MIHALLLFLFVASMVAVGIFVWKLTKIQESRDPKFQAKLDADDARAHAGRAAKAQQVNTTPHTSDSLTSSPESTAPPRDKP